MTLRSDGVMAYEGSDATLVPMALVAVTVNVTGWPLTSAGTRRYASFKNSLAATVALAPVDAGAQPFEPQALLPNELSHSLLVAASQRRGMLADASGTFARLRDHQSGG